MKKEIENEEITGLSPFRNGWVVFTAKHHVIMDNCTVEEAIAELRLQLTPEISKEL